jgi:hypothetical protein
MHHHELYDCPEIKVKLAKLPTPGQEKIAFPTMSKAQHDALDEDFAAVCYEEGLPFSLFESPAMKRALRRLNSSYKPPSRIKIAGPLLDKAYSKMKDKVEEYLDSLSELNVITDESSNTNKARIANISIHTPIGSIHWLSEDLGSMQSTAVNIAEWLEKHLHTLTHGNLERINSCANDTCSTMLSMWEHLRLKPGLQHLFFIPCDSHGIQLLIQDLINSIPQFKKVHDNAQTIAKAFKNAHLQYARLRDVQKQEYGRTWAIILAVATRWGTEKGLLDGLFRSKAAIQRYAIRFKDMPKEVLDVILSQEFWANLEALRVILKPLDEALRMSESNKSTLAHIVSRWSTIVEHLEEMKALYPSEEFEQFMSKERDTAFKPKGTFLKRSGASLILY